MHKEKLQKLKKSTQNNSKKKWDIENLGLFDHQILIFLSNILNLLNPKFFCFHIYKNSFGIGKFVKFLLYPFKLINHIVFY